jgi:hypothetical protein
MTTSVTQVTTAHIEPDYSTSYEVHQPSWKVATTFSSTVDTSRQRLVIRVPAADLNGKPFLRVNVDTNVLSEITLKSNGPISTDDKKYFLNDGTLLDPDESSGGTNADYKDLLAALFNRSLWHAGEEERVDAELIDDNDKDGEAPALGALWKIFDESNATDIDTILKDETGGYDALTKYSFAVMLGIALNNDGIIAGTSKGNASKIKLSEKIFPKVSEYLTVELPETVDIVVEAGAVFQFPFQYVHPNDTVTIVNSLVIHVV